MINTILPTNVFPNANEVRGEGPVPCDWFFLGEAPGREEDASRRPFVGPSGRLLNRLLEYYTDLRRPSVYVTNIVKHRPPRNRTPKVGEIKPYLPYLWEEIREVNPKVIVSLGASAAKVLDKTVKVTDDHGVARPCTLPDVFQGTLVPWFHPAYALRNPRVFERLAGDAARLHAEVIRVDAVPVVTDYTLTDEEEVVAALMRNWCKLGFDTETTSPTRKGVFMTDEADMVGYSVSIAPGQGWYVSTEKVGVGMAAILESPLWTKVMHNAKFDYKILKKQGVTINGFEDTKLAAYLLGEPSTGLKTLAKQQLGAQPISYEGVTTWYGRCNCASIVESSVQNYHTVEVEPVVDAVIATKNGEGWKSVDGTTWHEPICPAIQLAPRDMSELPPEHIASYAAMDADHTLRLWPLLRRRLDAEGLTPVYKDVEHDLIPVLAEMERVGMGVDVDTCNDVRTSLYAALCNTDVTVRHNLIDAGIDATVESFNINSKDQLAAVLTDLSAPLKKKTEVKQRYVVDADALESIRDWRPSLIDPLLEYAKLAKMITYVNGFIELRGPDGRLHTSFNQSGHWEEIGGKAGSAPSTGRLSSSGPNLMNVPHHRARVGETDWGYELRRCIVAKPDFTLLSADLGQEEPRIVAVLANDETLLDGFANDRDIYRPATEALYPYTRSDEDDYTWKAEWDAWERYNGKQFFLAWYYGAGAGRLRKLDPALKPRDVRNGLELLNRAHPARQPYLDETWEQLYENGYVMSMYGRKRWISKVWSPKVKEREEALREAANMRVQATAADILKLALRRIHQNLITMQSQLVSTVHDEVIIETHANEVRDVASIVAKAFDGLLEGVELVLEVYVGERWADRTRLT